MNKFLTSMKNLCTPAFVYLMLSVFSIFVLAIQNIGNTNKYCIGLYECDANNTLVVFVLKVIYIVFWTFILNLLCKSGFTQLSWFLVILPFLLLFVLIGLYVFNNNPRRKKD
jgi:hypothetical protein